jgi:hypothetical protein
VVGGGVELRRERNRSVHVVHRIGAPAEGSDRESAANDNGPDIRLRITYAEKDDPAALDVIADLLAKLLNE